MRWGHYRGIESERHANSTKGPDSASMIGSHTGALASQSACNLNEVVCIQVYPKRCKRLKRSFWNLLRSGVHS